MALQTYRQNMGILIAPYLDTETLLPTFLASFPEPISLEEWMNKNISEFHNLPHSRVSAMERLLYGERVQQEHDYLVELHRNIMRHSNLDSLIGMVNQHGYPAQAAEYSQGGTADNQVEKELEHLEAKEYQNIFHREPESPLLDQFKTMTTELDKRIQEGHNAIDFAAVVMRLFPDAAWYYYPKKGMQDITQEQTDPSKGLHVITWEKIEPEVGKMSMYYATYTDMAMDKPVRKSILIETLQKGTVYTVRLRTDRNLISMNEEDDSAVFDKNRFAALPSLLEFSFDSSSPDNDAAKHTSSEQEMLVPYSSEYDEQAPFLDNLLSSEETQQRRMVYPRSEKETVNLANPLEEDEDKLKPEAEWNNQDVKSGKHNMNVGVKQHVDPDVTLHRKVAGKNKKQVARLVADSTKHLDGNETGMLMGDSNSSAGNETELTFYPEYDHPGSTYIEEHELVDIIFQNSLQFKTALGRIADVKQYIDPKSPYTRFILKGNQGADVLHEYPLINRYDYEGLYSTELASDFYYTFLLQKPTGLFKDFVQPQGTPAHPPLII